MPNPAKHPDQRHGHRTAAENSYDEFTGNPDLVWPPTNPNWHTIAKRLWRFTRASGQTTEYQPSDVAVLYLLCDQISREYRYRGAMGPGTLTAVTQMMNSLLLTTGSRRAAKLELARGESEQQAAASAAVTSITSRQGKARTA